MDRFIPITTATLIDHLVEDFFFAEDDAKQFRQLARLTEQLFAHFSGRRLKPLRRLYKVFDPDSETLPIPSQQAGSQIEDLFDGLSQAFQEASFERLADETFLDVSSSVKTVQNVKIDVNLPKIERFALFHRGVGNKAQVIRPIKELFRKVEVEIPTYSRVAIMTRTRDDPHITLQLYKDVAQEDVELLLPTVNLRMKLLDRLKLSGAGGSAFISAIKLLRTLFIQVPKFLALPFKVVLLPIILIVTLVYGGKAFLDYSKIKSQYIELLRENLYELSLAKNQSVLALLEDQLVEERVKNTLLAYTFLYKSGRGLNREEMSKMLNRYIEKRFLSKVDFDVQGALDLLDELNLLKTEEPNYKVCEPKDALWTLDHIWDELYEAPSDSQT